MLRIIAVALLAAGTVSPEPPRPVKFTVRVENVSTEQTLTLSTGGTAPAPTAPVLWVLHTESDPFFTAGHRDRGQGLEQLAEQGDPAPLAAALTGAPGIVGVGTTNTPENGMGPGAITPGHAYEFSFTAEPGQRLTLAFMFAQSNDLFYAPEGRGILLFDAAGRPTAGDVTTQLFLWDAGTEVNEEPGVGPNQAPRQTGPDQGVVERKSIEHVRGRFPYPKVSQVIRVTVTPAGATS